MQQDSTRLCYKDTCVDIKGKAAQSINKVVFIGVTAFVFIGIIKAFR